MALTLDRWIAALITGALVAMVLVAGRSGSVDPRGRWVPGRREVLAERERQAAWAVRVAAERAHLKVLRDSIATALAKVPHSDTTRLVVSDRVPKREQVSRALSARLANALPRPLAIGVDMVVPSDTFSRGSTRSAFNYQILPASSSDRCIAISGALATHDIGARDWIGPCGFYATYGMPGANIGRWLSSGAWIYGSRWQGSTDVTEAERWNGWYNDAVPWDSVAGFHIRRWLSTKGYSCLTGNSPECLSLVLDPTGNDRGGEWYNYRAFLYAVRVGERTVWSRPGSLRWAGMLGPEMPNLLMDMSVSLGREKFARFWKSDLPPAEAFRAASGQDIGDWTHGWMQRTYGEYERGPGVTPWSAALGFLLGLVALGGASVTWRRRQVG